MRFIGGRPAARARRALRGGRAAQVWLRANWGRYWAVFLLVVLAGAGTALGMQADSKRAEQRRAAAAAAAAARALDDVTQQVALQGQRPRRGTAAYYRRTARKRVSVSGARAFLPLHREAGRRFGVSWRLLASIHRQETAFSTASTTYHGLNDFGCCAGPMQFNVTNGPVSTWQRYRQAFRAGGRPRHYPHPTRHHPSIYDDFDAIMAAASLLHDLGAGPSLDGSAWFAAYGYYGHDLYGVTYANEVLARAVAWERDGFCPNCALDLVLVEQFDDAYGRSVRHGLLADERREKQQRKQARLRRERARRERLRRQRAALRAAERAAQQRNPLPKPPARPQGDDGAPADRPPATTPPADAPATTPPAATTTTPEATPAPPPKPCTALEKLLGGCR